MTSRAALGIVAVALLSAGAAARARAQAPGGRCNLELTPANDSMRLNTTSSTPNGPRNVFVGGRLLAKCVNQDVRLLADSAEWYQQAQVLYLIGNVRYSEPRARVSSDQMTYFQADERLLATGNVEATLPSGSIMRGPQATYYRAVRGVRPAARLEAVQRPRLWLAQRDSVGKSSEPVQVTANQITTDNDSLVYAGGQVEITRSDLDARSDSAFLDGGHEFARLMIKPVIIGKGAQGYTLRGRQVELYTRNRIVQRVLAQAEARVTSQDMLLTSDTIDLRVDNNRAQAAYIWGKSRARAVSPDRDLIADSLAVRMPDQQLREVRAFRDAIATTMPDTSSIRSGEKDWLKGDTILAFFDSTTRAKPAAATTRPAAATGAAPAVAIARDSASTKRPRSRGAAPPRDSVPATPAPPLAAAGTARSAEDSTSKPQLRLMQAIGKASARYQVPAEGGTPDKPGINYSRGDRISVVMDTAGVSRVQIDEHAVGVYLEPIRDSIVVPRALPDGSPTPALPIVPSKAVPSATTPAARPAAVPSRTNPARP